MEYQVFELDPECELSHKGEVLYESDNLAEACTYAWRTHQLKRIETCVWQPRHGFYRDYYKFEEVEDGTAR